MNMFAYDIDITGILSSIKLSVYSSFKRGLSGAETRLLRGCHDVVFCFAADCDSAERSRTASDTNSAGLDLVTSRQR